MAHGKRVSLRERISSAGESFRGSPFWESMFRPGSPFKKGYSDKIGRAHV